MEFSDFQEKIPALGKAQKIKDNLAQLKDDLKKNIFDLKEERGILEKKIGEITIDQIKPKFFGKSNLEKKDKLYEKLKDINFQIEISEKELSVLCATRIKDQINVYEIQDQLKKIRSGFLEEVEKKEDELALLKTAYNEKLSLYQNHIGEINSFIEQVNHEMNEIENSDFYYKNGAYWSRETNERVEVKRMSVSLFEMKNFEKIGDM